MVDKIEAVIFDVDGVLINVFAENGCFIWTETVERDLNITPECVNRFFRIYGTLLVTDKLDTSAALSKYFSDVRIELSPDQFIRYWLEKTSTINTKTLDQAIQLRAAGYRLCLGTNQERYRSKFLWDDLNLRSYFDDSLASCYLGHAKPSSSYFKAVEDTLQLEPEQIAFIDDMVVNVDFARKRGWLGYHHRGDGQLLSQFCHSLKTL